MNATLETPSPAVAAAPLRIALVGNPNAGKTTLFNALTGMRQKVGNYPGVTVEKKEGRCRLDSDKDALILDLPGTYSLTPRSPDEEIARDVLLGLRADTPPPDAVLVVVDASNLERNLYLATQVLELGLPTVLALNMTDVARTNNRPVDAARLSFELGVPVVETVAVHGVGLDDLKRTLAEPLPLPRSLALQLPEKLETAVAQLAEALEASASTRNNIHDYEQAHLSRDYNDDARLISLEATRGTFGETLDALADDAPESGDNARRGLALRLLCGNVAAPILTRTLGEGVASTRDAALAATAMNPAALGAAEAAARYAALTPLVERVIQEPTAPERSFSDKADAILTHKFWGMLIFALITLLVFKAIFSWANAPMNFIDAMVTGAKNLAVAHLAQGPLRDLLVDGVLAGVGAVIIFLPQILILFFFIGILEDSGYMARAAFLMDRMMSRVGLHGRAFIPLMSSFACAIPGVMATRTIANRRDRMTTILIAPLMSCSARLPVYWLMVTAFIPNRHVFLIFNLREVVIFSMYALGIIVAMLMAWLFKKTLFKGPPPPLLLELPPYKTPAWRNVLVTMWDRASQFLKRAGTTILAISIVLWFLLSYPKIDPSRFSPQEVAAARLATSSQNENLSGASTRTDDAAPLTGEEIAGLQTQHSFAGTIGRAVEPLIRPLGFNWKIGIGLIGAMSAREVFVSTIGNVYSVSEADETSTPLRTQMARDRWPDGRPVWTPAVGIALLVYFVLAMQCISTLVVVRRETNSWKWPLFMQCYMTALAWIAAFIVYQVGSRFF